MTSKRRKLYSHSARSKSTTLREPPECKVWTHYHARRRKYVWFAYRSSFNHGARTEPDINTYWPILQNWLYLSSAGVLPPLFLNPQALQNEVISDFNPVDQRGRVPLGMLRLSSLTDMAQRLYHQISPIGSLNGAISRTALSMNRQSFPMVNMDHLLLKLTLGLAVHLTTQMRASDDSWTFQLYHQPMIQCAEHSSRSKTELYAARLNATVCE